MYGLLKPLLFRMDPERAHELGLWYLERIQRSSRRQRRKRRNRPEPDPRLAMNAFGIRFPEPLGVAAGFDKGARVYNALLALGFGHVEVGTVTPRPQEGNPRPRVERYPEERAIVNRLGFPNPGQATVTQRLHEHAPNGVVGANVGRNKASTGQDALQDYEDAAAALAPATAYVTINVSSPNTPGLRALQEPDAVAGLVARVLERLDDEGAPRPVLLKLHPDAAPEALVATARAAIDAGAAGIVAVNTTTERPPSLAEAGQGGLSGAPLRTRATRLISRLHAELGAEVPLVGVGGIETGEDALERVRAGASILQAYTGFVYRGPRFAELVHQEMLEGLDAAGVDRLDELVGTGPDPSAATP